MTRALSLFFAAAWVFTMSSCAGDDDLERLPNPNLTDTTGLFVPVDLLMTGRIDGEYFTYEHNKEGYVSRVRNSQNGWLPINDSTWSYIQTEFMLLGRNYNDRESWRIEIIRTIPLDSTEQSYLDSLFTPALMNYYSSPADANGVQLFYIDADSTLWSSSRGNNSGTFSRFALSEVIKNEYNGVSKYIAFGEFNGYLYDEDGRQLEARQVKFKLYYGKK